MSESNPPAELLVYRKDWTPPDPSEEKPPKKLPEAPPWRDFKDDLKKAQSLKGEHFQPPDDAIAMVNAALTLRRPLLITGSPGTGKSTLAYAVAEQLGLGTVLKWAITTKTTLKDGLYTYDAIARLQEAQGQDNRKDTGNFITLGPLGTAFVPRELPGELPGDLPRVLLIDEIDKSDIDLPNDLLNLFEDGEFPIPELQRLELETIYVRTMDRYSDGEQKGKQIKALVNNGVVRCRAFPLVIMTSNGERDFPPPFLRRCLRFKMPNPTEQDLKNIVQKHLGEEALLRSLDLVTKFCEKVEKGETLATDQLLNVIHWRTQEKTGSKEELLELDERLKTQEKTSLDQEQTQKPKVIDVEERLLKDLNSPEE